MKSILLATRAGAAVVSAAFAAAPAQTTLFFDNFDGSSAAALNGTTPDVTTGGADWIAMQSDTDGRIMANGTIDIVAVGDSTSRGGSATLAFTPQSGFVYQLDLSVLGLASSGSATYAGFLTFGFADGQSSANSSATRLDTGSTSVTGKLIQSFYLRSPLVATPPKLNKSHNDTSASDWSGLGNEYGGDIDLRIVLDTSISGGWTATWFAKRPSTASYTQTRATQVVSDTAISSVGFGFNQVATGRISGFSLTATLPSAPLPKITGIVKQPGGNVVLTLDAPAAGLTVQQSHDLSAFSNVPATAVGNTLTINAANVDPNADGADFYRLSN